MKYVYILFLLLGSLCVNAQNRPKTITIVDETQEQLVYKFRYNSLGYGFSVNPIHRNYSVADPFIYKEVGQYKNEYEISFLGKVDYECRLDRKTGKYYTNKNGIIEEYELSNHVDFYGSDTLNCCFREAKTEWVGHEYYPVHIEGTKDIYSDDNDKESLTSVTYTNISLKYADFPYYPREFDYFGFVIDMLGLEDGHLFDLWYKRDFHLKRLPSKIEVEKRVSWRGKVSYRGEDKFKYTYKFYDHKFNKAEQIISFKIKRKEYLSSNTYIIYIDYYDF